MSEMPATPNPAYVSLLNHTAMLPLSSSLLLVNFQAKRFWFWFVCDNGLIPESPHQSRSKSVLEQSTFACTALHWSEHGRKQTVWCKACCVSDVPLHNGSLILS